jgi:hypothetical protein
MKLSGDVCPPPFVTFDVTPPPVFSKGWYRISEEIKANEEKREKYRKLLLAWLDSQCGTGWRAKVVVIDLVLPNPTESMNTISGFLIGRQIGDTLASDILHRHEQCVLKLKSKRMSIGLNGAFMTGLPQVGDEPLATSRAAQEKTLEGKTIGSITKQHMLYSSVRPQTVPPADAPPDEQFYAKVIGYTPQKGELNNPLGGTDEQRVEDNWAAYLDIVREQVPEVTSVAAMSIATPIPEENLALVGNFNVAGQIFLGFSVDARTNHGDAGWEWDPDCISLIRALVIFALMSNASLVRQAALSVERSQYESHELGAVFTSLRTRLLQFTNPGDPFSENLVQSGTAIFFKPLWLAAVQQIHIWTNKTEAILSSQCFAGCSTLRDWIDACWRQTVDFCAIREFGDDFESLQPGGEVSEVERKIENWRSVCWAAIKIESEGGLDDCPVQPSAELAGLVRGMCAVMRDVIKHEGKALAGGAETRWSVRIERNQPANHIWPEVHTALIIEQTNALSHEPPTTTGGANIGKTTLVVRRYLPLFAFFERLNRDGVHVDKWYFAEGSIYTTLMRNEDAQ